MQFQRLSDTLRPAAIAFIALLLAACGSGDGEDKVRAPSNDVAAAKQMLVFRDDFGGPAVGARAAPRGAAARIAPAALPTGNWVVETGYGQNGWGNDEWQRYTNSMDNLFTEDGSLVIRAKCATAPACGKRDDSITSARIITKDRLNVRYGSIKARIKMPSGLGMWPAFWTLGADIDERRWPNAGEIDIVEMHYFFSDPFTTHFATHWAGPRYTAANRPACASGVPAIDPDEEENCKTAFKTFDQPLTDDFHIYELVWNQNQIVGKIDGITYFTQAIDSRTMEEFLKEHYLLLNVAVGGTLGGPFGPAMSAADWADPDQTDMLVDWVEVYEFVPPTSGTLIDESGNNMKYNKIINSVEVGGAFVEFDLDSTAVSPLVGSSSLELKYSKSVSQNGGIPAGFSAAIFDFNNVNLSSFTHFNFSIDSSRFPGFDDIGIEFEDNLNRKKLLRTSTYTPVAASGSWRTYSVPLGDFSPVDMNAIIKIGFFNPNDVADALIAGTLYVDDIVFTTRACTPGATVDLDSVNYNPATSVAQVSVSDACKANKLVTVKVENGSDEIYLGVKLDAAGNGSAIFGLIDPLSVCPTDDSKGYIALSPPLIATYTNSSRGVSYIDTATAGVDAGAPGTSLAGARDFFFATDPSQPLAYVPDAPVVNSFNFSVFGSASLLDGAFADTSFDPVFQVRSGAGYGAEVAQLVLINIPQGFAAAADSIDFKFKNVGHPVNGIRVEFGELGVSSNLVSVDLADTTRSTPLGDDWYQVRLPMSDFPDASNFDYFGFITPDPAPPTGSGFYFLITDINLQESITVVPDACAELVEPPVAGSGTGATGATGGPFSVSFDDSSVTYGFTGFGSPDTITALGTDPLDSSNTVAITTKPVGAQVWAGVTVEPVPGITYPLTTTESQMTIRIYAPGAGVTVRMKLEESGNASNSVETEAVTTVDTGWETLTFDFNNQVAGTAALNPAFNYDKLSLFFGFGTLGDGTAYTFDTIEFVGGGSLSQVDLPVSFDDPTVDYTVTDFGGNATTLVTDPTDAGNTVAQSVKSNTAELWAGTTIGADPNGFATAVPFSATETTMTVRVYSPDAGIPVRMKVEDASDATITVETEALTTMANAWETLTFDFSNEAAGTAALNLANTYDKVSIFFNFGTDGVTAGEKTYLWDDVQFVGGGGGGPGPGSELVTNGDFETSGLSGWLTITDPNGGTIAADGVTVSPNNGSATSARMTSGPGNNPVLKQERFAAASLGGGDSVTVSYDLFGTPGVGSVVSIQLITEIAAGGVSKVEDLVPGNNDWTAGWTTYSFTTTVGNDASGGISLQFVAIGGAGNLTLNVDNVSIILN